MQAGMDVQSPGRTLRCMRKARSYWNCTPGQLFVVVFIITSTIVVYFGRGVILLRESKTVFFNATIQSVPPRNHEMKTVKTKYGTQAINQIKRRTEDASFSRNLLSKWKEVIQAKSQKYKRRNFFKFIGTPISDSLLQEKIVSEQKVVLLWNKFSGQKHWIQDKDFAECKVQSWDNTLPPCRVTENQEDLPQSDAIIVFANYMEELPSLPDKRLPHQHLVLYCRESPIYTAIDFEKLHGLFNSTATYRLDSDYIIDYGRFTPKPTPLSYEESNTDFDIIMSRKTKLAVARISNCRSHQRIDYIHELQKYIPVDFFGNCGNTPCEEVADYRKCKENNMEKYRFHMSFENNCCRDYITEKFWLPLVKWNSVPVVMGGESPLDYTAVAPPGSYINTADFDSPKHLAQYLQLLQDNQTYYEEYFHWRKRYEARMNILPKIDWCSLCSDLHNISRPIEYYKDLKGWYEQDICRKK